MLFQLLSGHHRHLVLPGPFSLHDYHLYFYCECFFISSLLLYMYVWNSVCLADPDIIDFTHRILSYYVVVDHQCELICLYL